MTDSPGASSAAAISLSAEFLAPPTRTVPLSGRPPVTVIDGIGADPFDGFVLSRVADEPEQRQRANAAVADP